MRLPGFCFGLGALACLLLSARLPATGPYMFGSFGTREVSNQDMNDFFAMGSQGGSQFIPNTVGEAYLTAGYRFTDPFALEVGGGAQQGREESSLYPFGDVDLQVPTGDLSLLSIAPVFCFDTFGNDTSTWLNQVGLRLDYAQVSGVETLESAGGGISSLDFNGATVGWGLFYRLVNLWAAPRLSVGLEAGYEALKFTDLEAGNPSGVFVGQPGHRLENLNGAAAYLDNSGFYARLVIGWAKDSSTDAAGPKPGASGSGRAAAEAALLAKARALRLAGDKSGALQCYRAYLVARPTDAEAWMELGKIYQDYGRGAFAQDCFDRARELGKSANP
jgi:hypothetical protein